MEELFVNRRLRVKKDAVIHIVRHLPPINSQIHVKLNQELSPIDVLGEGQTPLGYRNVRLASELKVAPKQALQYLKRELGQSIYKGELLASKDELFGFKQTVLLSPADGVLDSYDPERGNLRMKLVPKSSRLASGVYGLVDKIDRQASTVTIKTLATLVYGVFGSGQEREGILRVLESPDLLVGSRQIPNMSSRQILVGGAMIFEDGLQKALSLDISGVVTGGINAMSFKSMVGGNWNLFSKQWSDVGISVVVTEGFGAVPLGEDIFNILKSYQNGFAMINGNRNRLILPSQSKDSIMYIRRTSLPVTAQVSSDPIGTKPAQSNLDVEPIPEMDVVKLESGDKVRVISGAYIGLQGTVNAIDQTATKLPSGITAVMVTVTGSSSKVRVPYLNIEAIA
ncbi:hypothetical protein M1563_01670 [Patescibacteria group bacterium]|nr:hypothetical protein [Patescibacteria group bacterium]MCL5409716.1 hypothetical protein [Patescibacteria group bacterium]